MKVLLVILSANVQAQNIEIKTYYDDDGKFLKEILHVTDSQSQVLQGPYELYYLDGGIQAKGQYQQNIPSGTWEYYFESGGLKMKGELRDNTNYGPWVFYYENGKKSREGELYRGKRQGKWTFYYENGEVKSEGNYVDSVTDGIWNYYYEEGKLKGQAFFENGAGNYKEFYSSGSLKVEGRNFNGKSDGLWKYYYETGELQSEGLYVDGVRQGEWKFYYPNGNTSAIGNYNAGKQQGKWTYYYEDGQLSSEGTQSSDQKDGYWKLYYDTGELKGEGQYEEGDGEYKEYYPNGNLKITGQVKNGHNQGKWRYFYEDGRLEGEADFMRGEGRYVGYYPNGNKKTEGEIKDDRKIGDWKLYDEAGQLAGLYKPIYEDAPPVYRTSQSIQDDIDRVKYEKPEYRFKNKKVRYFSPVINEYKGGIIGFNPFFTLIGELPISIEYYKQERLGYEFQAILHRNPFFKSDNSISLNKNFTRGIQLKFRQKFYHAEGGLGAFYFAHEISFSDLSHKANVIDSTGANPTEIRIASSEQRYEYGITIGTRWFRNTGDGGPTIDAYVGVGIGYRDYKSNHPETVEYNAVFADLKTRKTSIPVIFGVNFGLMGPKREKGRK
ncbi:MAG: toxin-antitoxin system YwqK family antitoxin [Cyclobacteriaceae bacterium]